MKKILATFIAFTMLMGTQVSTAFAGESVELDEITISNVSKVQELGDEFIYICGDVPEITFTEDVTWMGMEYWNGSEYKDIFFDTLDWNGNPIFDTSNLDVYHALTDSVMDMEEYLYSGTWDERDYILEGGSFEILCEEITFVLLVFESETSLQNLYLVEYLESDEVTEAVEEEVIEEEVIEEVVAEEVAEEVVVEEVVTEEVAVEVTSGTATPTTSTVMVDGVEVPFDAYNIDNNNYFKLRDVAYALNGTESNFEVTWNSELKSIEMISGAAYTEVGSELSLGDGTSKTYVTSTASMYLDGEAVSLVAYTIDGNTYFKLRDLGDALGFDVSWDNTAKVIGIVTNETQTAEVDVATNETQAAEVDVATNETQTSEGEVVDLGAISISNVADVVEWEGASSYISFFDVLENGQSIYVCDSQPRITITEDIWFIEVYGFGENVGMLDFKTKPNFESSNLNVYSPTLDETMTMVEYLYASSQGLIEVGDDCITLQSSYFDIILEGKYAIMVYLERGTKEIYYLQF